MENLNNSQSPAEPPMTPDQLAASLPPDVAEAMAEADYDADFLADAPAMPGGYSLNYSFRHSGLGLDEGFDARFRQAALAMGLPKNTAAQVWGRLTAAMATSHRTGAAPTDADLALGQRAAASQLERLHGPTWEARLADANAIIKALPPEQKSWFVGVLESSGAGNDVALIDAISRVGAARRRQNLIKK